MNMELIQRASAFATHAHRHQTRNDGTPYVSHCFRVAMTIMHEFGFEDEEVIAAALLHDTIEDCDVDYDDILEAFTRNVANYVAVMTKDMRLEEEIREVSYDKQLQDGPWQGRLIKLADVYDNYSDADTEKVKLKLVDRANRILTLTVEDSQLQKSRGILETLIAGAKTCS